jgi:hypothetical protein
MNKEQDINDVLNSLNGIKRAEVNPFLYNRILNKIGMVEMKPTPVKLVWLAAASFALLALLNFQAFKTLKLFNSRDEAKEVVTGYHLLNTNTINYN